MQLNQTRRNSSDRFRRPKRKHPGQRTGVFAGLAVDQCCQRQAKWLNALLASAMRWVFSRFWIVVPVLL